jgi:2-polyprenyl-6-methoxyphenol hydroxylase-like FAD-dependent oxidoreductase
LPYPSVAEAEKLILESSDGGHPLEPYQLISQYTLEPLLKSVAEKLPSVSVRYGCEFLTFKQDDAAVTTTVRMSDGTVSTFQSDYLVGCDGGGSPVRKQLGIKLQGDGNLLELRQALYRCDNLFDRIPIGKGRHYHVADNQATFLIVQDDTKHFTLHAVVDTDADMKAQFEKTVSMPVDYEMLYVGKWKQNLLLADRYREKRVFMAGDAVHLVIPTGGLGMNTGVGDAIDLSWKLAATLQGWGGKHLLDSYETERRQVGDRNVQASRFASTGRRAWRSAWRPNIRDKTPEGEATRKNLIAIAGDEQRKSNEMIGAELGYRYTGSPIIPKESGEAPDHDFVTYRPSTWPGSRLPHVWLDNGRPVQDMIGQGYTLLRLGGSSAPAGPLAQAMHDLGAPFEVLDINDAVARDVYGHDLLLLRPDMHVVWRSNASPADPVTLARIATGQAAVPAGHVKFATVN